MIKQIFIVIVVAFLILSCNTKNNGNLIISGKIKGLKKGTLILQKENNSVLVPVDSVTILNDNTFSFSDNITSARLYFLTYSTNNSKKTISFFAEQGNNITIDSKIDSFDINPKIIGSKNQNIYEEYLKVKRNFSFKNLNFIEREFNYKKEKKIDSLKILKQEYIKFVKLKYLFTTNFAINNKNLDIAAFLALTELNNTNLKLLDTINNSLTKKVKQSYYGKKLEQHINQIENKMK